MDGGGAAGAEERGNVPRPCEPVAEPTGGQTQCLRQAENASWLQRRVGTYRLLLCPLLGKPG